MRMITTDDILRVVEPLVYARRGLGMLVLVLLLCCLIHDGEVDGV